MKSFTLQLKPSEIRFWQEVYASYLKGGYDRSCYAVDRADAEEFEGRPDRGRL